MASAIDSIVAEKVSEATKPLKEEVERSSRTANDKSANDAMESFWTRHKVADKEREPLAEKMYKTMQKVVAGPDVSVEEYLDTLYKLVGPSESSDTNKQVKKVIDRMKENANDLHNKSGDGGTDDSKRIAKGSPLPTLDEAVKSAVRGERLE